MRFKNISYHAKLFVVFSIVMLFVGTTIVGGFYFYIKNDIRRNSSISIQQSADKIASGFNYMLDNMNVTASQICADNSIQEIMLQARQDPGSSNYFDKNLAESSQIASRLYALNSPYMISARITLFDDVSNYIHFGSIPYTNADPSQVISQYKLAETLEVHTNSFFLVPPSSDHWNTGSSSATVTFSLIRRIYDLDTPTFPSIGYVDIQQPYSLLDSVCTESLSDGYNVQILDRNGTVVYPYTKNSENLTSAISKEEFLQSLEQDICINSSIVYCSSRTNSDWIILLYQDKSAFLEPELLIRNYMFLFLILFYIVGVFLIYKISRSVTRPIRDIIKNLEHISIENTSLHLNLGKTNNELILLNDAFETTLERLTEASRREIQAQANESYSHMLALQAQMNPHFLYNTLMALNGLALQKEYDKISLMCSRLSSMLRYTASYDEQDITIADECEYTLAYLELMKIRYDDFLQYELICDDQLKQIKIPKLIIQPIVENCFKHGFTNILPPYKIKISIYVENNCWMIAVHDNGCGFDPDYIQEFENAVQEYEQHSENISSIIQNSHLGGTGLKNLYIRSKLYFKEQFTLTITNAPDGGSCVTIGGQLYEKNTDCG